MNQIHYGQITKYGEKRGSIGDRLGEISFGGVAETLGGYGEAVRDPAEIGPAPQRARQAILRSGSFALVNIWATPPESAPGIKVQAMYK